MLSHHLEELGNTLDKWGPIFPTHETRCMDMAERWPTMLVVEEDVLADGGTIELVVAC